MTPNVYLLIDLVLSGSINYLLQKQEVDALLTLALTEKRDISVAELNTLKVERDKVSDEVNALLDSVS
jgi:hypothetical protein